VGLGCVNTLLFTLLYCAVGCNTLSSTRTYPPPQLPVLYSQYCRFSCSHEAGLCTFFADRLGVVWRWTVGTPHTRTISQDRLQYTAPQLASGQCDKLYCLCPLTIRNPNRSCIRTQRTLPASRTRSCELPPADIHTSFRRIFCGWRFYLDGLQHRQLGLSNAQKGR